MLRDGEGGRDIWKSGGFGRPRIYRKPVPMGNAIIAQRSEVGYTEYNGPQLDPYGKAQELVKYAVKAESIINIGRTVDQRPDFTAVGRFNVIRMLGMQLAHQIED